MNITSPTNNKSDEPGDFYSHILNMVKSSLTDQKDSESYKRLLNFGLGRTHLKKAIMTIPYNASLMSTLQYIES